MFCSVFYSGRRYSLILIFESCLSECTNVYMDNIWGGLSDGGWIFNYRAPLGWVTSSKTWLGIWKALGKVSHVGSSCILVLYPQKNWPHMEQHLGYKHDPSSPIFLSFFPQCTTQIYFLPSIFLKSLHLCVSPTIFKVFYFFVFGSLGNFSGINKPGPQLPQPWASWIHHITLQMLVSSLPA